MILSSEDLYDIRGILQLGLTPMSDISDELLTVPFQLDKRRLYEFIGDGIFHMVVIEELTNDKYMDYSSEDATNLTSLTSNNQFFTYLMNKKGLCKYVANKGNKGCANAFESLLGVFHMYLLSENYSTGESFDILSDWCFNYWRIEDIISSYFNTKEIYKSVTKVLPVLSPWSKWSPCINNQKYRTRNCISGDCTYDSLKEYSSCSVDELYFPEWSKCDKFGLSYRKIDTPFGSDVEVRECETRWSECDENGIQYKNSKFTGGVLYERPCIRYMSIEDFNNILLQSKDLAYNELTRLANNLLGYDYTIEDLDPIMRKISNRSSYVNILNAYKRLVNFAK